MTMLEKENNKVIDKPDKVAYFKGCAMKMFFPEASQATVKVLGKVAKVNTPESVCCGMPQLSQGMIKQARIFIENDKASMCCGGSGSFQYKYPLEANKVLNIKEKSIEDTNAEILVTECPSCIMQLSKAGKYKVLHISQVL